jgi:3-methylcrotonyl-CoA carboxylase alpha subunit
MRQALAAYHVVGLSTNIAFLQRLVKSEAFRTADLDTGLIERNEATLFPPPAPVGMEIIALAVAALLDREARERRIDAADQHSPWTHGGAWRLNGAGRTTYRLQGADGEFDVCVHSDDGRQWLTARGKTLPFRASLRDEVHTVDLGERTVKGQCHIEGDTLHVFSGEGQCSLALVDPLLLAGEAEGEGGKLAAPMPGRIIAVMVEAGATINKGDALIVMEAMKMEHTLTAPAGGTVQEVLYAVGDQVQEGAQLVTLEQEAA